MSEKLCGVMSAHNERDAIGGVLKKRAGQDPVANDMLSLKDRSPTPAAIPTWARTLFALALLLPVLAFVLECLVGHEVGVDGNVFRYIGADMARGGLLYETAWDNKGPFLFLPQFLGYLLSGGGTWGPGLVIMLLWVCMGIGFWALAARFTGSRTVACTVTYVLILTACGMDGMANQNSQEPVTLFVASLGLLAAFFLSERTGKFLLGVSVGIAFLVKPCLISFGGACAVMWAYDFIVERDFALLSRRALWSFIGFAGTLLAATGYFALSGRAFAFWDATFLFGFYEYGRQDISLIQFWRQWIEHRMRDPFGGNHNIWILPMFLILLGVSVAGCIRLWNSGRRRETVFLATWLVGEYTFALCMRQFFEHYLVMVCPTVAILSVYALQRLSKTAPYRRICATLLVATSLWYMVYCAGMAYAIRRNNCQDNWRLRMRDWAGQNHVEQLITIGSLPAAGILDELRIKTEQKYFAVTMNYGFAKAPWRKREMESDLLRALRNGRNEWLFAEKPLPSVAGTFAAEPKIAQELSRWNLFMEIPNGGIYRRTP